MGEGAGVVVLEEYEHAKARGAKIYAELIGYGLSGDAYHITAPAEDGDGAYRCMNGGAEARRHRSPTSTTSTPTAHRRRSATRSSSGGVTRLVGNAAGPAHDVVDQVAIGHLLGAAGAVEAIFSMLAIRDGIAPPTLNLDNPSVETVIDLVPHVARSDRSIQY
jgi:3-oxoacyl-[acyl-carrier-protein] synthase II